MQENRRTSLLVRCSRQDAQTVHAEASASRRSVSGYLLYVLEQSIWIEDKFLAGAVLQAKYLPAVEPPRSDTAIHLRCTGEEADRIRGAAKRRLISISSFVLFSLHRHWRAVQRVRNG